MLNSIQGTSSLTSNTQTTATKDEELGKDDFLNLLVTQLKNQDPLNPMDSANFTAQLAQFSSLEQLTNVNTNLDTMIASQADLSNYQALSYLGKSVFAYGNQIAVTEGASEKINFELDQKAEKVFVQIYDSSDKLVRKIEESNMNAGSNSYHWDGKDANGNTVADGAYTFEVYAYDANDVKIDASLFMEKTITGVSYDNGNIYLNSGEISIPEEKIFKVAQNG